MGFHDETRRQAALGRNDVRHRGARADRQHGAKLAQRQTPGPMVDDAPRREMPDKSGNRKKTRYDYCAAIRNKPVSKLTTEDALRVLKPLWQTRPETANRLRGRCERVWDFAKARAHCSGENPFRWRGHLNAVLPPRARLTRGHYKAMPFAEVPAFVGRLRAMQGVAPRALEFAILTAARSGEILGARWDEIDLPEKVWTVPATRMKAGKEHRVILAWPPLGIT
jgi:integrase